MFWEVLDWKRRLLNRLDRGVLNACEWEAFIRAAMRVGCPNMAADLSKNVYNEIAKGTYKMNKQPLLPRDP